MDTSTVTIMKIKVGEIFKASIWQKSMNKKTKLKTFVWDMVLIDLNNWTARRAATCPAVTFSGIVKK